jgi:hypothetical protein
VPAVRVKRCGKSAPRLRQRKRHGKPHREQNRIGAVWNASVAPAAAAFQDRCPDPAVRVGCSKRRATGVPEEWPSRVGPRPAPHRTRLTGRLIREGGPAPQRAGPPPVSLASLIPDPDTTPTAWRTRGTIPGAASVARASEYPNRVRYTELAPDRFRDFWRGETVAI